MFTLLIEGCVDLQLGCLFAGNAGYRVDPSRVSFHCWQVDGSNGELLKTRRFLLIASAR